MPERVEQIEGLALIEVDSAHDEHLRIWNELMLREHPLHDCRLVGRQLRYLIGSAHGWLGGIGLGSSALYLESRDKWIGWDEGQRAKVLQARQVTQSASKAERWWPRKESNVSVQKASRSEYPLHSGSPPPADFGTEAQPSQRAADPDPP